MHPFVYGNAFPHGYTLKFSSNVIMGCKKRVWNEYSKVTGFKMLFFCCNYGLSLLGVGLSIYQQYVTIVLLVSGCRMICKEERPT